MVQFPMPSCSNRRMKSTATVIVHPVSGDNLVRCTLSSPGCLPRQGNFACQKRQTRDGPQNPFTHGTQRLKVFLPRSAGICPFPWVTQSWCDRHDSKQRAMTYPACPDTFELSKVYFKYGGSWFQPGDRLRY